jgi:hypothetical protein
VSVVLGHPLRAPYPQLERKLQLDRLFSPLQIPRMLLQARSHEATEVSLGEYMIWVKGIDAYQANVPHKKSRFC